MSKKRADVLLFEQGLFNSRSQAQRAIMAGLVNDHNHQRIDKSGEKFPEDEVFHIKDDGKKYVSRGGFKLEKALQVFNIDLKGKKIAVQDTTSSSGWVFPVACMEEHGININKDHIQTVQVKGYDQAVMSVYNGNTDAAFIFQGARNLVKKDAPDVMQKVVPIYTTPKIPNN